MIIRFPWTTLAVLVAWVGLPAIAQGQQAAEDSWPRTRAERTDYRETSSYRDVLDFLGALRSKGAPLSVRFIGTSTSGHRIPMVVAGRPLPGDPATARRSGKPIVCIQANIHAGEVEGKEAALMLLRDLVQPGKDSRLLDELVLIVLPIYNIDGNEELGPRSRNRPHQLGPESVGVRHNGQKLDLNRDYMKLDAPETRAAVAHVFRTWDPDVFIDLHATNGTLHGYQLTYSPPLHPDTPEEILAYTRDELLLDVRGTIHTRYGLRIFDYGNTPRWDFRDKPFAWYTNRPEPRYSTNYMGLRGRISVLSEAMSHLPFEDRVEATYRFVQLILEKIAADAPRVIDLTRRADRQVTQRGLRPDRAPELGVRFGFASRGREKVLLDKSETPALRAKQPKDRPPGPPKDVIEVEMDVWDRFVATRTRRLPVAYLLGRDMPRIVSLLKMHGIVVEKTGGPWQGQVESFRMDAVEVNEKPYQGHRLQTIEGTFVKEQATMPAGSYLVRTAQPLGLLVFQLLEPESLDGVVAWNLLGEKLEVGAMVPIRKCHTQINTPTKRLR